MTEGQAREQKDRQARGARKDPAAAYRDGGALDRRYFRMACRRIEEAVAGGE